jgi:hypothetical protein
MTPTCEHPRCRTHPARCEYATRIVDPAVRFWSKVNKDGPVPPHRPELGPCWVWMGQTQVHGYGVFSVKTPKVLAHRFAFVLQCGPLARTDDVCHHCDNPPCIRGSHLFKGNAALNAADMVAKGRHAAAVHPEAVARGERAGPSKLTNAQVVEIKARLAAGEPVNLIAADYAVKPSAISHIKTGRNWKSVASDLDDGSYPKCRECADLAAGADGLCDRDAAELAYAERIAAKRAMGGMR